MPCGFVKAGDCYVNLANVTHVHLEAGGDAVVSYASGGVTRFQGDAAVAIAESLSPDKAIGFPTLGELLDAKQAAADRGEPESGGEKKEL